MDAAFRNFFYIDTRSLNLFRLGLSAVVVIDLAIRLTDITAHYSEEGVLPLSMLYAQYWGQWTWSLAALSDNILYTYTLFIATIAAAVLLFAGYRPRLMTALCWVGLLSVQNRNPVLYQGGDDLLRMLLFWSFFLPLNNDTGEGQPRIINNVATMAILCQVLFGMYFSGLFKGKTEWWQEGSAIYYALSLDQIARYPGLWLSQQYPLTVVLTRCIYLTEILLFPLFLIPFSRDTIRIVIAASLALMFTGIILCMMIGIFPLCYIASVALFIPTSVWDRVQKINLSPKMYMAMRWLQRILIYKKPSPDYQLHWGGQAALGFVFALVILWNIASLPSSPIHAPYGLDPLVYSLRLNQSWGMFAPTVLKQDGWLVYKAELNDKTEVDLNASDLKLSYNKPAYVLSKYKNDRWRKYTEQLYLGGNMALRPRLAAYLTDKWNREHKDEHKKINSLSILFMLEVSRPYRVSPHIEPVTLYETGAGVK